jgi:RimJ/RimL family protein N-acetyltransferase
MPELRFQTSNYLLRPLGPADISDQWAGWLESAEAAARLNAPRRKLSRRELEDYLRRFDNRTNLLLGVFHRPTGTHIGIFTVTQSRDGQHALLNILMGAAGFQSVGGLSEIRDIRTAVGNFLFFEKGYRSVVASVVATNAPMIAYLKLEGYELVKRAAARRADGSGTVELLTFRLTRERYVARNGSTWVKARAAPAVPAR